MKETVKSADRVLDIIEYLASEQEPKNLTELSRALHMPPSSAYKIVQNLLARGYLETDQQGRSFRLGYKILEIGTKFTQNTNVVTEFQYTAQKIINAINESVYLSIRNGKNILYIAEKQGNQPVRFVSHLGMQLPMHATAMGKMLLSQLSDDEIKALYPEEELGALTDRTIRERSKLIEEIQRIRKEKIAFSDSEAVQGIFCLAAGITNASNQIVAAMSISIPQTRLSEPLAEQAKRLVMQAAKELSVKIYFQ